MDSHQLKEVTLDLLRRGQPDLAVDAVLAYQSYKRGASRDPSAAAIPDDHHLRGEARYFLNPRRYLDLDVSRGERREFAALFTCNTIQALRHYVFEELVSELFRHRAGFPCPDLNAFSEAKTRERGLTEMPTFDTLLNLYRYTKWRERNAAKTLAQLGGSGSELDQGVKITCVNVLMLNENCPLKKRHYRWAELDQLPRLPCQWGCSCRYSTWRPQWLENYMDELMRKH